MACADHMMPTTLHRSFASALIEIWNRGVCFTLGLKKKNRERKVIIFACMFPVPCIHVLQADPRLDDGDDRRESERYYKFC